MLIKILLLISYAIILIAAHLFVEKRLQILNKRHQQKIGGGYAAFGLLSLQSHLKIILRIISLILFILTALITMIII